MNENETLKNSEGDSRSYRWLKIILSVLGATIVLAVVAVAVILVAISITNNKKSHELTEKLSKETVEARHTKESTADAKHQMKVDLLKSSGVIDNTGQAYSEKTDNCFLDGNASGWIYTSWQQRCHFSYTDYLPISLSKDLLITKLTALLQITNEFGQAPESTADTCTLLKQDYTVTLRFIDSSKPSEMCAVSSSADGTAGEIISEYNHKTFINRTFSKEAVNRNYSYIEVSSRSDYYTSEILKCKSYSFMCDSPVNEVAPGF